MQVSYRAVLQSYSDLSPNTRHFQFKREDGGPISFVPGEFVRLGFQYENEDLQRSFSIATVSHDPANNTDLEIAIAFVEGGRGSNYFFNAEAGDIVDVYGPFGQLTLPDELPPRLWLIATGTGVTPYRAMLPQLKQRLETTDLEVTVLFGARTREELLYQDDFLTLSEENSKFNYLACYSREKYDDLAGHEFLGHVNDYLAQQTVTPNNDRIFLCGNPDMVEDTFQQLKQRDFGVKQVRREKYVFSNK
jgi:ferredoxin-NADP reductase